MRGHPYRRFGADQGILTYADCATVLIRPRAFGVVRGPDRSADDRGACGNGDLAPTALVGMGRRAPAWGFAGRPGSEQRRLPLEWVTVVADRGGVRWPGRVLSGKR